MTHQMTRRRRGDGQHRAQCVPPLCMHMAEPPTAGAAADELDDEGKLNRDIANESYQDEDKRKDIGDYKYQAADSSKRTGVWRNAKTNKTVVGLRGTKDLKDLYSDIADPKGNILRGTQRSSDQYKADREGAFMQKMQACPHPPPGPSGPCCARVTTRLADLLHFVRHDRNFCVVLKADFERFSYNYIS